MPILLDYAFSETSDSKGGVVCLKIQPVSQLREAWLPITESIPVPNVKNQLGDSNGRFTVSILTTLHEFEALIKCFLYH